MKKFFIASLTFMLLIASCFGFVACKTGMENDTISESNGTIINEKVFTNQNDFKIKISGDKTFKAEGKASIVSTDQAGAFEQAVEGAKYVVLEIESTEGSILKYGFVSSENKDKSLGEVNPPTISQTTMGDDDIEIVVILDSETNPYWRLEITKQGESEHGSYLVDFSGFYNKTQTSTDIT